MAKFYVNLVKRRPRRTDLFWTVDVVGSVSVIKTRETRAAWHVEEKQHHPAHQKAVTYARQQALYMCKDGYEYATSNKPSDRATASAGSRRRDTGYARDTPYDSDDTLSVASSTASFADIRAPAHRKQTTAVLRCRQDWEPVRKCRNPPGFRRSNSVDRFLEVTNRKYGAGAGVSRLQRRRSLRIEAMQNSERKRNKLSLLSQGTVDMVPALANQSTVVMTPEFTNQNTVVMATPPAPLERMQTSGKWNKFRKPTTLQSQETLPSPNQPVTSVKARQKPSSATTRWRQHRGLQREDTVAVAQRNRSTTTPEGQYSLSGASSLVKRKSTTRDLRMLLGDVTLEKEAQQDTQDLDDIDGLSGMNPDIALIPQSPTKKKSILSKSGKSPLKKKVTMAPTASTTVTSSPQRRTPKRQASSNPGELLRAVKRMRTQDSEGAPVYRVERERWPLELEAPVTWSARLTDTSGKCEERGLAVHIDERHCFIGTQQGTVHELNSSVQPVRCLRLHTSVTSFAKVQGRMLGACTDGTVLDFSTADPSCVWVPDESGDLEAPCLLSLASRDGSAAVSDNRGCVYVTDDVTSTAWKMCGASEGNSKVLLGDNGLIYHVTCTAVTCYDREKGFIFRSTFSGSRKPVSRQGKKSGTVPCALNDRINVLYVACGTVVLCLDANTGRQIGRHSVSSRVREVTSLTSGSNLLFLADDHSNKIICLEPDGGEVIYVIRLPEGFQMTAVQYFDARIYCVGQGYLYVLDLTELSIKSAIDLEEHSKGAPSSEKASQRTTLKRSRSSVGVSNTTATTAAPSATKLRRKATMSKSGHSLFKKQPSRRTVVTSNAASQNSVNKREVSNAPAGHGALKRKASGAQTVGTPAKRKGNLKI